MKIRSILLIAALSATALPACQTIDEARYAGVPCQDLKQLVATNNLAALGAQQETGAFSINNGADAQGNRNLFKRLEKDEKRDAELRAAFRNNCR